MHSTLNQYNNFIFKKILFVTSTNFLIYHDDFVKIIANLSIIQYITFFLHVVPYTILLQKSPIFRVPKLELKLELELRNQILNCTVQIFP